MTLITITYEKLMAALALFTALCVAGGWLIKIIKGIKKPADDVAAKLRRDNERLNRIEGKLEYFKNAVDMNLEASLVILEHLGEGNHTGEMLRMKREIQNFLIKK
ncbi:MAG: hypothetical protein IKE52_05965 [Mogibacterium sp.]|nr:hypothetical protein [Mogibacterium sp.]